jgi:hypothetical protein
VRILGDVTVIIVVYEAIGARTAEKCQRAPDEKDAKNRLERFGSHHPIMPPAPSKYKGA